MSQDIKRVELVLLEDTHRKQFFDLNVEFITWMTQMMSGQHQVDIATTVDFTIEEYVQSIIGEYLSLKPPIGVTYLLQVDGHIEGMGALKELEPGIAEIKRMFIRPAYRGRGFGILIFKRLMQKGREFGFTKIRLETSDFMTAAHEIYRSEGFREIEKYAGFEAPEAFQSHSIFMEKELQ